MPHILQASADLTGSGIWTAAVDADALFVHVTTLGTARKMDLNEPARLFQAGWLAIGEELPETGNPIYWMAPFWIDFEQFVVNMSRLVDTSPITLGLSAVRYELMDSVVIHAAIYTFS